jgi:hypothetical protein
VVWLGHDCAPLRQRLGAFLPVVFPADEVPFLIKMVVDGDVNRGEFLGRFHLPELEHGPFSSSERLVCVLGPVVLPAAAVLAVLVADLLLCRATGAQPVGDDRLGRRVEAVERWVGFASTCHPRGLGTLPLWTVHFV